MENDRILEKVKMKIAISQVKREEEITMNKNEKVLKNIGIAACTIIALTGSAFAGKATVEKIWKTPEKIENPTMEITEESIKGNISEDEAKEIAINKLKEIGFNTNIIGTNHYKEIDSNTIMYRFDTEDNYEISIDGKTGKFFEMWNNNQNIQDCNINITVDEANEIASQYYKLFGFKDGEYEITQVHTFNNEGEEKDYGYKIDITYNKKYGEIYNPYECISMSIESKNKELSYFRVVNLPFDNNEIIITEEEAIKIALKEDEKIETNNIISTKAKQMIVQVNTDSYERIYNTEKYYEAMQTPNYPNEERDYYNVDEKVRNAWVVVITYEESDDVTKRYTENQYSYFIDCTTGEIIGGDILDYTQNN